MSEPADMTRAEVDFYNLIASERGMPPGWRWFELRAAGPDAIVRGAVCTVRFKSGPRKGCENWSKRDRATEHEIVITRDQLRARRTQWERDTGKCVTCFGTGAARVGWSSKQGSVTAPCGRCKSTGQAPTIEVRP